jgi:hypothetical protein
MFLNFVLGKKGRARRNNNTLEKLAEHEKKREGDGGEIVQMTTRHGGRGRSIGGNIVWTELEGRKRAD